MSYLKQEPEDYARLLLAELKLTRVNDLNEILVPLRLILKEKPMVSFEGTLVCRKDRSKGIIAISESIREEGRKRFTVCHEIGHFILPGHGEAGCRPSLIESWRAGISSKEEDANRVASELLLPSKEVYPLVLKKKASIALAKEIAADFNTSLTAAALKINDLSEEPCAVVWSFDGHIKWFKKNPNFFGYVATGRLDDASLATALIADGENRRNEGSVHAETWLVGDNLSGKMKIWEDSIFLPYYNSVLTLLTAD